MVAKVQAYHQNCVDAFRMECSKEDIRSNTEARKLAKYINKQARKVDKIVKLANSMR